MPSPATAKKERADGGGGPSEPRRSGSALSSATSSSVAAVVGESSTKRLPLVCCCCSCSGGGGGEAMTTGLAAELYASTEHVLFSNRLTWFLLLGPVALVGDSLGLLNEAACFACAGAALIPCAERLSFITEQVAEHTNGTIGALLNATFGNAPELLIAVAALKAGFYRVVQLAMLGSMMTNMILVFGVSCLIGGLRWQVQNVRVTSGNVSVVMLLVSTAGSLFPATLILSGQFPSATSRADDVPTDEEVTLSRVNAAVMFTLYVCYLTFQLGTHKEEFDDEHLRGTYPSPSRHNTFCRRAYRRASTVIERHNDAFQKWSDHPTAASGTLETSSNSDEDAVVDDDDELKSVDEEQALLHYGTDPEAVDDSHASDDGLLSDHQRRTRRRNLVDRSSSSMTAGESTERHVNGERKRPRRKPMVRHKSKESDVGLDDNDGFSVDSNGSADEFTIPHQEHLLSMRVGVIWLFIITLCVSALSDILVDTIDGFAMRMNLSEVFTSMVIIPFFSNVAEQVSAFLFAYRNEMDLCVGVTIGSAIQIACFVLPGSVLIGMLMDRSMTLYFHSYETASLFFGTVVVAAVLQGGTTNWMVGASLVGIYVMLAAGIWFHELENLSVDGEEVGSSGEEGEG